SVAGTGRAFIIGLRYLSQGNSRQKKQTRQQCHTPRKPSVPHSFSPVLELTLNERGGVLRKNPRRLCKLLLACFQRYLILPGRYLTRLDGPPWSRVSIGRWLERKAAKLQDHAIEARFA